MELLQVKETLKKVHILKLIHINLLKGLVGQLQRKRSDIGFANLFMVPDRMKYIDYTDPYMIEYASFMLSKISSCYSHLQQSIH